MSESAERKEKLNKIILCALIILPLIIGLCIYVTVDFSSYPHVIFSRLFKLGLIEKLHASAIKSRAVMLLRYFLCDFCWSFSLECSLWAVLKNTKRRLIKSAVIAEIFLLLIEVSQHFGIIKGTFDIYDIITETAAVLTAGFIIKLCFGGKKDAKIH